MMASPGASKPRGEMTHFASQEMLGRKLLSVTVKWLAVKTASEMTYTVSGGALNSTQKQSTPIGEEAERCCHEVRFETRIDA